MPGCLPTLIFKSEFAGWHSIMRKGFPFFRMKTFDTHQVVRLFSDALKKGESLMRRGHLYTQIISLDFTY